MSRGCAADDGPPVYLLAAHTEYRLLYRSDDREMLTLDTRCRFLALQEMGRWGSAVWLHVRSRIMTARTHYHRENGTYAPLMATIQGAIDMKSYDAFFVVYARISATTPSDPGPHILYVVEWTGTGKSTLLRELFFRLHNPDEARARHDSGALEKEEQVVQWGKSYLS